MKLVIQHEELKTLLREALRARGAPVPERADIILRCNHKKNTVSIVIDVPLEPSTKRVWVPPDCGCFNDPSYTGRAHQSECATPKAQGHWEGG